MTHKEIFSAIRSILTAYGKEVHLDSHSRNDADLPSRPGFEWPDPYGDNLRERRTW